MLKKYNIHCSQKNLSRIPHTTYVAEKTFLKGGDEISACESGGSTKYYRKTCGNVFRISSEKYDSLKREENVETALKKVVAVIPYEWKNYRVNFYDSPCSRSFWGDTQVMKVEYMEGERITFPPFFSIYCEITDDKRYDERTLALNNMVIPKADDKSQSDIAAARETAIQSIMQTVRTYPESYIRNAEINIYMETMLYDGIEDEVIDAINADDLKDVIRFVSDAVLGCLDIRKKNKQKRHRLRHVMAGM